MHLSYSQKSPQKAQNSSALTVRASPRCGSGAFYVPRLLCIAPPSYCALCLFLGASLHCLLNKPHTIISSFTRKLRQRYPKSVMSSSFFILRQHIFTLSLRQPAGGIICPRHRSTSWFVYDSCYTVHSFLPSCCSSLLVCSSPEIPGSP